MDELFVNKEQQVKAKQLAEYLLRNPEAEVVILDPQNDTQISTVGIGMNSNEIAVVGCASSYPDGVGSLGFPYQPYEYTDACTAFGFAFFEVK